MSQLLFVIGVGGIQVLDWVLFHYAKVFNDKRQNDYNETENLFMRSYILYAGYRTMFITIISAAVHEISVAVLDLLLLSSFINYFP